MLVSEASTRRHRGCWWPCCSGLSEAPMRQGVLRFFRDWKGCCCSGADALRFGVGAGYSVRRRARGERRLVWPTPGQVKCSGSAFVARGPEDAVDDLAGGPGDSADGADDHQAACQGQCECFGWGHRFSFRGPESKKPCVIADRRASRFVRSRRGLPSGKPYTSNFWTELSCRPEFTAEISGCQEIFRRLRPGVQIKFDEDEGEFPGTLQDDPPADCVRTFGINRIELQAIVAELQ